MSTAIPMLIAAIVMVIISSGIEKTPIKPRTEPIDSKLGNKAIVDILKDLKLGYSYSHISNNDWGDINAGTDNQQITFSKNF